MCVYMYVRMLENNLECQTLIIIHLHDKVFRWPGARHWGRLVGQGAPRDLPASASPVRGTHSRVRLFTCVQGTARQELHY